MKKIIFASKNKGKIEEVKHILGDLEIQIVSLLDINESTDIEETGTTFEENAFIKAKEVYDKFRIPTIADDSGLVVEQLNDRPGVYSSRYAGEECDDQANNKKLLVELKKFPQPHPAKFVCAAIYYDGEKKIVSFGEIKGRIIDEERGKNGFGYDPIFVPDGYTITSAELDSADKNSISHRFKAFNALKDQLR
ncbi:RdgB/HAM1 family non-canonical purine NTP pyrophosphatase [bacterium BMS3Abin03]|nr:RdgB/HAM1 family non-canonical purine NTP pyrophosphatase [bacterium BMS3Abin03]MCG6960003.1 RdgB/HAM1 family non-canonical purine NTP pyrophosphatase [bacterium BMS3Abin03]